MQTNNPHYKIEYTTNIFINGDTDTSGISHWKEKLISILEKVPSQADTLKPLIQFIVVAIAPTKIYMLQHTDITTTATDRYIDLLIIISGKSVSSFTEMEPVLEIAYLKDQRVSCSLHHESNLLGGLRNGHAFYSLNCIPENLVYDDKTVTYPITTPEALLDMKNRVQDQFMKAFEKALHFYESAVALYQKHPSAIVSFMLHQAVELTYRGILLSLNGYDKKTHEIRALKKHARRCSPLLNNVFPDNTEDEKHLLNVLENAYLNARYGEQYDIPDNELPLLFQKVELLQTTAKEIVAKKIA
ncbi:HEPN domain-containing protein [Chitinophaga sp. LS1]|uniref:HEPN domain-containing protein n=1 Tax=Chitinophaga sp. LS1 TaxID=3051176 RepID=UPI002AAA8819|nr:HEPN domain-containing protein [Chitinophaga sp. LS1]WPV65964.1 HEPN domain-containing protein [Chitinophaga sp. LS1]